MPRCGAWCSRAFLAYLGDTMERRIAPRIYRSSRVVTLSESSRTEIIDLLGLRPDRVTVAPPGVDPRYSPGGQRSPTPLVVAVGRLVPVKRFDALLRSLAKVKADQPELQAVLIGEGNERPALEALREELGATDWVSMPGRVDDQELVAWYRRAWVVASSSQREGWGMTLTEAAACGTPAVATAIAGHADAVLEGESGLLVEDPAELSVALCRVLGDEVLRSRLSKGALARARWFTWDVTARARPRGAGGRGRRELLTLSRRSRRWACRAGGGAWCGRTPTAPSGRGVRAAS